MNKTSFAPKTFFSTKSFIIELVRYLLHRWCTIDCRNGREDCASGERVARAPAACERLS